MYFNTIFNETSSAVNRQYSVRRNCSLSIVMWILFRFFNVPKSSSSSFSLGNRIYSSSLSSLITILAKWRWRFPFYHYYYIDHIFWLLAACLRGEMYFGSLLLMNWLHIMINDGFLLKATYYWIRNRKYISSGVDGYPISY
jgi:hypothetical protein